MLEVPLRLLAAALPVRCVNCGGDNSLSLVLAIVSAVVAVIAAVAAARSLVLARRLYNMQKEEHEVFLKELTRRAQVAIMVELVAHVQPATSGGAGRVILRLTFDNSGERAAHNAIVNVLVPESVEHFERCRENGERHPKATDAVRSRQDVPWTQGLSKMLSWGWDVLTLATNQVAWVCISLGPEAECPLRVNLASDDLPPPYQVDCDYTVRGPCNENAETPEAAPTD